MTFVHVQHPAAQAGPQGAKQGLQLPTIPPFKKEEELGRFRGMAFEEGLLSLISMNNSGMVGADQLREFNSNVNQAFQGAKIVENGQFVKLADKRPTAPQHPGLMPNVHGGMPPPQS